MHFGRRRFGVFLLVPLEVDRTILAFFGGNDRRSHVVDRIVVRMLWLFCVSIAARRRTGRMALERAIGPDGFVGLIRHCPLGCGLQIGSFATQVDGDSTLRRDRHQVVLGRYGHRRADLPHFGIFYSVDRAGTGGTRLSAIQVSFQ